jgi:hypothetical protein
VCTSLRSQKFYSDPFQRLEGGIQSEQFPKQSWWICALTKICGSTSDNILSARLITAAGELITIDNSTPDLLWALKGAGQFFGLVTELTLRTYPLSILGTDDGTVYTGTFIFDIPKVGELAKSHIN